MLSQKRRRYAVLATAGVLHVLVIELILHAPPTEQAPAEEPAVWSTLILLPDEAPRKPPPRKPEARPHTSTPGPAPAVQTTAPAQNTSITVTPGQKNPGPAVDWMSELDKTSRSIAAKQTARSGLAHEAPPGPGTLWPAPPHKAGEQYTLETGEKIVWVSDHCFVVSEPPLPGTPNAMAHSQLTHTECHRAPTRGDLFKDLPAYQKHHADSPDLGALDQH